MNFGHNLDFLIIVMCQCTIQKGAGTVRYPVGVTARWVDKSSMALEIAEKGGSKASFGDLPKIALTA